MKPIFTPLSPNARLLFNNNTGIDMLHADMSGWFCVTVLDHDLIAAVLACEPKTSFDWHFSAVILDPRAITRKLLRVIFSTLFSRAARITALVEPGNDPAIRLMDRLGFTYEGFLRRGLDGRRDALLYGMLPEDCPWIYANPRLLKQVPPRAEMH